MAKRLIRPAILCQVVLLIGCGQLDVRIEIQEANRAYLQQRYDVALQHYLAAKKIDPSFVDLDRLIGYCYIGRFEPENPTPANQALADRAVESIKRYLLARPDDAIARDALVSFYLSADRRDQAIAFFADHLKRHPDDLDAAKSIATLYAKAGDFSGALRWYREITRLDSKNPEAFYIYGVVLYEKVAKSPDALEIVNLSAIEDGKQALAQALALRPDYFEALVYTNLLYREQAERESDPVRQQELLDKADEFRARAIAIQQARKAMQKNP